VAVSTSDPAALRDRLTGFGNRERLVDDLHARLEPVLLAVFWLDGFRAYRDYFGRLQSDTILVELADRLDRIVGTAGTCYRPREDELAVVAGADAGELVGKAAAALNVPGRYVAITCVADTALLPDETDDPLEALRLADERLFAASPGRPPRERRSTPRD
jgi:GGDEF domain-containing protein